MQPLEIFGEYALFENLGKSERCELFLAKSTQAKAFSPALILKRLQSRKIIQLFESIFLASAETTAQLEHERICKVHDFGKENNKAFLVREYIPGKELRALIRRHAVLQKRIPLSIIHYMMISICEALEYAEREGICHGGLSSRDVIVGCNGQCKVINFGMGAYWREVIKLGGKIPKDKEKALSPEHFNGPIDQRSDIYSLGVIYSELLTGAVQFAHECHRPEDKKQDLVVLPAAYNHCLPSWSKDIIAKMIASEREQRFNSSTEVKEAIQNAHPPDSLIATPEDLATLMKWTFPQEVRVETAKGIQIAQAQAHAAIPGHAADKIEKQIKIGEKVTNKDATGEKATNNEETAKTVVSRRGQDATLASFGKPMQDFPDQKSKRKFRYAFAVVILFILGSVVIGKYFDFRFINIKLGLEKKTINVLKSFWLPKPPPGVKAKQTFHGIAALKHSSGPTDAPQHMSHEISTPRQPSFFAALVQEDGCSDYLMTNHNEGKTSCEESLKPMQTEQEREIKKIKSGFRLPVNNDRHALKKKSRLCASIARKNRLVEPPKAEMVKKIDQIRDEPLVQKDASININLNTYTIMKYQIPRPASLERLDYGFLKLVSPVRVHVDVGEIPTQITHGQLILKLKPGIYKLVFSFDEGRAPLTETIEVESNTFFNVTLVKEGA